MPALPQNDIAANDSQVSWPTPFWTLIALAINVLVQPHGNLFSHQLESRARYPVYLCINPALCLLDAIHLSIHLLSDWIGSRKRPGGVGTSVYATCASRGLVEPSATAIYQMPMVRVLLALWAIIQSIKLLSCSGVPGLQFLAYCYLVPFSIFEILGIALPRIRHGLPRDFHDRLMTQPLGHDSSFMKLQRRICDWLHPPNMLSLPSSRIAAWMACLHLSALLYFSSAAPKSKEHYGTAFLGMMCVFAIIALLTAAMPLHRRSRHFTAKHIMLLEDGGSWDDQMGGGLAFVSVWQLLAYFLEYCMFVYDPSGTHKPQWTDILG